ncbi:MAG: glycoside hydrolase family 6 protein [bacterium]
MNPFSESASYFGHPSAFWFVADDSIDYLRRYMTAAAGTGDYYLVVQYIMPRRDRGGFSGGGAADSGLYLSQVNHIADTIRDKPVILIMEPDELCFDDPQLELFHEAIKIYRRKCSKACIFIDAGNPAWRPAPMVAERLRKAGIEEADGFSVNVSSFHPTARCIRYGDSIARYFPGKKYVIDTSRNGGSNPAYPDIFDPQGIATGSPPTFDTGNDTCFAFLWVKPPGESDGKVHPAGTFDPKLVEHGPDSVTGPDRLW